MTPAVFTYFECPACEFSSILARPANDRDICPLCAGDNGRDVRMQHRPARDDDRPEGRDARKQVQP